MNDHQREIDRNRCATCRYFERSRTKPHFGRCRHPWVSRPESVDLREADNRIVVVMGGDMVVGERFGCIHHASAA